MLNYILSDYKIKTLYLYSFNNPHACTFDTLKTALKEADIKINIQQLNSLTEILNKDILTVVCGSFYMIDELLDDELKSLVMG